MVRITKYSWLGLLSLMGAPLLADYSYNMSPGVTPMSHEMYQLHMTIFWICVVIGVLVFSVMFYAIIMHRKSRGHKPSEFHEHFVLEVTWAIIPLLILVLMAIPATIVLFRMEDTGEPDLTIKVTGYQWRWKYEYLDLGISFFSTLSTPQDQLQGRAYPSANYLLEVDNPLVLPIHKKIRFLVTSNDVIHSWWVREIGIKKDGIPGFINASWASIEKTGTYRGQCAELCGVGHAFMPIVVEAKTEADFNKWVEEKTGHKVSVTPPSLPSAAPSTTPSTSPVPAAPSSVPVTPTVSKTTWTKEALMKKGEESYNKVCAVCHKPDGTGMPPTFPALKDGKITKGPIAAHIDIVLNGKTGTTMQAFGLQMGDEEIAALVTYERNAWGNNMGDVVQPADIQKVRK